MSIPKIGLTKSNKNNQEVRIVKRQPLFQANTQILRHLVLEKCIPLKHAAREAGLSVATLYACLHEENHAVSLRVAGKLQQAFGTDAVTIRRNNHDEN